MKGNLKIEREGSIERGSPDGRSAKLLMSKAAMIVEATLWRVRRAKQHEARQRDKDKIRALQLRLEELEWTLRSWESWWWSGKSQGIGQQVDCHLAAQEVDSEVKPKCIEYSKWDHLELSSSDEHSDIQDDDVYGPEVETEEENNTVNIDPESCIADYMYEVADGEEIEVEYDDCNDTDEGKCDQTIMDDYECDTGYWGLEPDEAEGGDLKDGVAPEQDSVEIPCDGSCELSWDLEVGCDASHNKQLMLKALEAAVQTLQPLFAAVEAKFMKNGRRTTSLASIQSQHQQQFSLYAEMIKNMEDAEFTFDGSKALRNLIYQWRDDIFIRLNELRDEKMQ